MRVLAAVLSLALAFPALAENITITPAGGGAPSGSAGDDLSGTYPNPTVAKINGTTPGTGVSTALGVNVGTAGAVVVNGGALGTPSSGTLTSATGLPVSTGVSGLGTGVVTALGTNVGSAGAVVVNGGALGTPSSGTSTSATGLPIAGLTGLGTGVGTLLAGTPSGTVGLVGTTSPALITPNIGVATAASVNKVTITAPASSATLTIADGKVGTFSNTLQLAGTDSATLNFGAWTTYTPTVTCGQSTGTAICAASGVYKQIDKTVHYTVTVSITGTFTVGTMSAIGLPVTAATRSGVNWVGVGKEVNTTGAVWSCIISSAGTTLTTTNYTNSNTIVTNQSVTCTGTYEGA